MAEAEIVIDLARLAANYRHLAALSPEAICAPVIKGDGYGHGMLVCGATLMAAGAKLFFVATLEDAVGLRNVLPDADIAVLGGVLSSETVLFAQHSLLPVLNDLGQVALWSAAAQAAGRRLKAIIHIDTGMNRLGLVGADLAKLAADPRALEGIDLTTLMSHLASADDLDMESCAAQRDALLAATPHFPQTRLSLANSHGSYFGAEYRLDMYRPGQALYGIPSDPGRDSALAPVASVFAPLIQVKEISRAKAVGYSQTWRAARPTRVGTVAVGYANGYPRSASSRSFVAIDGVRVPVIGRVSMDLLTVDVSAIPEAQLQPGQAVEIIGPTVSVMELASIAGTIERDLTIAFGRGCRRRFVSAPEAVMLGRLG